MVDQETLIRILAIGHDTSMRGAGLSLRNALVYAGYSSHRFGLTAHDLLVLIRSDPNYVEQWCAYSEDKRTSGGWYLLRDGEIGQVGVPASRERFDSIEEATAAYVLRELDFWTGIGKAADTRLHRPRSARR